MANNPLETGARNHHSRGRAKPSVTIATPRSRPPSLKYLLALALAGLSWLAALSTCNYRGLLAPSSVVSDDKIDLAWQPVVVTEKKHGGNSSDPFALARSQSFGFFYDITDDHWRRYRQKYLEHENHRLPDMPWAYHPEVEDGEAPGEIYQAKLLLKERLAQGQTWAHGWASHRAWYQNNYEPNFTCQFEKRVGIPMNGEGGKWVCDPHRIRALAEARKARDPTHPGCVIYSIGSNGDFGFELGMQQQTGPGTCEFHIFDFGNYEAAMRQSGLARAFYHRWGLVKQKQPSKKWGWAGSQKAPTPTINTKGEFYGLLDIVRLLGHQDLDVIDVFKIDCEKCEWDTYTDWLSPEIPMLHQILVEVHGAPKDKALDFYDSMEKEGYLRFHKEPNIQWDPNCIEYAMVKVDREFMGSRQGEATKDQYIN